MSNTDWKDADVVKENQVLLRRNSVQGAFKGYYYDKSSQQATVPSTKQSSQVMDSQDKEQLEQNDP